MSDNIVVKPVSYNTFDVFFDKGWDTMVRIHKVFDKKTKRIFFSIIPTEKGQLTIPRSIWADIKAVL